MKAVNLNSRAGSLLLVSTLIFLALSLTSCARKIRFPTSTAVPAAQGYVKVKKDKNNNYKLDINIRNLAEADRLNPPRKTYVVWIETEDDEIKNLGQMKSTSGFLSKKLKASLVAVTPFRPRRVFITAEDDGNVLYPSPQMVLRTRSF